MQTYTVRTVHRFQNEHALNLTIVHVPNLYPMWDNNWPADDFPGVVNPE